MLALLVAALVLSLVELGGDPQPVAKAPTPGATPAPSAAPDDGTAAATPTTAPQPGATPEAGATPSPGATPPDQGTTEGEANAIPTPGGTSTAGGLAQWPAGKTAWTVILASKGSRAEAETEGSVGRRRRRRPALRRLLVARKGYWVVFAGQYPDQEAAAGRGRGQGRRRLRPPRRPERVRSAAAPSPPGHHGAKPLRRLLRQRVHRHRRRPRRR